MRVHDSQAYRKMDVTRERISHILELREILLSIKTGLSLVNAAVVCAILESISGLEPSSVKSAISMFKERPPINYALAILSSFFFSGRPPPSLPFPTGTLPLYPARA